MGDNIKYLTRVMNGDWSWKEVDCIGYAGISQTRDKSVQNSEEIRDKQEHRQEIHKQSSYARNNDKGQEERETSCPLCQAAYIFTSYSWYSFTSLNNKRKSKGMRVVIRL